MQYSVSIWWNLWAGSLSIQPPHMWKGRAMENSSRKHSSWNLDMKLNIQWPLWEKWLVLRWSYYLMYSKTSEKLFIIVWMLISDLYMSAINTTSQAWRKLCFGESYAFQLSSVVRSFTGSSFTNLRPLKVYMIVNFRACKISRDTRKLVHTSILI